MLLQDKAVKLASSQDPRREFVVPIGRRSGATFSDFGFVKQGGLKGQVLEFLGGGVC